MEQVRNAQLPGSFYEFTVGLTGDGATENMFPWKRTQHLKPANAASQNTHQNPFPLPATPIALVCSHASLKSFHFPERLVI